MNKIDYSKVKDIFYYHPNIDLSEQFYTKFSKLVKTKECYNNIFHIFNNHRLLLNNSPNISVVYGGVQIINEGSESNFFVKHCFFKLNDEVIDPTLYKNKILNSKTKYFSVIEYSLDEYLDMLTQYKETYPVSIIRELNKVTLNLMPCNILYVG